jgi:hypothetical protein
MLQTTDSADGFIRLIICHILPVPTNRTINAICHTLKQQGKWEVYIRAEIYRQRDKEQLSNTWATASGKHLKAGLNPVELSRLEELGGFEGLEQVLLVLVLGRPMMQLVEKKVLQKLLVAYAHLDRIPTPNTRSPLLQHRSQYAIEICNECQCPRLAGALILYKKA